VRRILILALAVAALAAAAGCGGGGGGSSNTVTPEAWSASVCGAVSGWVEDLQADSAAFGDTVSDASSISDVRDQMVEFIDGTIERTDEMLNEVEAAGQPDVEDGGDIADLFQEQLTKFKTALEEARATAEDLPDDQAGFAQGAQEIGATMTSVGTEIGQGFEAVQDKYHSEELRAAFEAEPACGALGNR
jgi:hypothetical protein